MIQLGGGLRKKINLIVMSPARKGKATIATGHIETLTETGIEMANGERVEADLIISATGLTLQENFPFSTIQVFIDGQEYRPPNHLIYNSKMIR